MNRYLCIHGHFYQPPRENPWLEEVEMQDSAYPYHDWNERITAECYAPNAAARVLDADGQIIDIINNYAKISFNFGPTVLSWMEHRLPDVYQTIIEADRESQENFSGHGAALAQVYNHVIMPLANRRDKRTQVLWGLIDFQYRFGRKPEGMWLAETAADIETLETLAEHDLKFAILAPHQAQRARRIGGKSWRDVSGAKIDPRRPYLCRLPSGKTINLFFYDGPISQALAFGGLLSSGESFAHRLVTAFVDEDEGPQLVHIATDGETYGHHHRYGEMALAYALRHIELNNLAKVTIYGEYLELQPPTHEVRIMENTSWSCGHGIERWRSDCGCNSGREGWRQQWRGPLRNALDWLRDSLIPLYERELAVYLRDPWEARDDYIQIILDRSPDNIERFLTRHAIREIDRGAQIKVLRLLEMQRNALLMYTSCGWFFDEISGLETTQVLQYAARTIQLAEQSCGVRLEPDFIELLAQAPSNIPEHANGADVYEKFAVPATVDLLRVAAHYAVSSLFADHQETADVYAYTVTRGQYERKDAGRQKLVIGQARLCSRITWDEEEISFAVHHLGDHSLLGGARKFMGDADFESMRSEMSEAFSHSDLPEIIRLMDKHFESHNYSLWHLFKDEQRKIFNLILESTLDHIESDFRQIYEQNYPIMQAMRENRIPLPKALATPAEYTLNRRLRQALECDAPDLNQLNEIIQEIKKWGFEGERTIIGYVASKKISQLMERLNDEPRDLEVLRTIEGILQILHTPQIEFNLGKAQQIHFRIARQHFVSILRQAEGGSESARDWIEHFDRLGTELQIKTA
jgi:alpha-amylase/alpha-mannosidase (GH57 family)